MINVSLPYLFYTVPFFIGAFLCGISGAAIALYLICLASDKALDKLVRTLDIYNLFLDFAYQRIKERKQRNEPYKSDRFNPRRRPKPINRVRKSAATPAVLDVRRLGKGRP